MRLDNTEIQKEEKLVFRDYFSSLTTDEKKSLRDKVVPLYISYSSFYRKVEENSFSELEFEKIESLTNHNFKR